MYYVALDILYKYGRKRKGVFMMAAKPDGTVTITHYGESVLLENFGVLWENG